MTIIDNRHETVGGTTAPPFLSRHYEMSRHRHPSKAAVLPPLLRHRLRHPPDSSSLKAFCLSSSNNAFSKPLNGLPTSSSFVSSPTPVTFVAKGTCRLGWTLPFFALRLCDPIQ